MEPEVEQLERQEENQERFLLGIMVKLTNV